MKLIPAIVVLCMVGCTALPGHKISSFRGQYNFLSNFYPATVEFEGLTYPDVEHAYQSAKTLDMNLRRRIAALPTPAEAKKVGESFPPRRDWLQIKYQVMLTCVRYKFFHHPELAQQLLATDHIYLEEGNTWHDQIWGVYQGHGTNWLGKILMQVRHELRSSSPHQRHAAA
ncbi:MAG TPA: NADAR family protein [Tepidisphaeraceae bacterium]